MHGYYRFLVEKDGFELPSEVIVNNQLAYEKLIAVSFHVFNCCGPFIPNYGSRVSFFSTMI